MKDSMRVLKFIIIFAFSQFLSRSVLLASQWMQISSMQNFTFFLFHCQLICFVLFLFLHPFMAVHCLCVIPLSILCFLTFPASSFWPVIQTCIFSVLLSSAFFSFIVSSPVVLSVYPNPRSFSCPRGAAEEQGARGRGGIDQCGEWGNASGEDFGGGDGCGAEDGASRWWKFRRQLSELF